MESNPALDYNDGMRFDLQAPYKPTGDQPQAIAELVEGVRKSYRHQVLLGATGTGKTFTVANVIQQLQLPTLVMTHNKTLAAQLYAEYKDFFPNNAVEYFVSYYDYYQPEAYIPRRDLYIEKETLINEEIDRLRLAATTALMSRQDVIIVASVSAIYGLGDPELYKASVLHVEKDSLYGGINCCGSWWIFNISAMSLTSNRVFFGCGATRLKFCRLIQKKKSSALIFLVMKLRLSRVYTR